MCVSYASHIGVCVCVLSQSHWCVRVLRQSHVCVGVCGCVCLWVGVLSLDLDFTRIPLTPFWYFGAILIFNNNTSGIAYNLVASFIGA
jgi:hypothetical protein